MYTSFKREDSLSQGDVCRDIPLPLLTDTAQFGDAKAQQMLGGGVPSSELLATRSNLVVAIPLLRAHVVVLSQSCDAEDVERKGAGRILVAPVLADDHERFLASFEGATKDAGDAFVRKLAASAMKGASAPAAAMDKGKTNLDNPRRNALKSLWLGNAIGAFPLAADESAGLARSVCYFDNVVSLPPSWIGVLRERRVLRLRPEWGSVLQEAVGTWLGRFAFPGSLTERLRAGGLVEEAAAPSSAGDTKAASAPPENAGS